MLARRNDEILSGLWLLQLRVFGFGLVQDEQATQRLKPVEWRHINRNAGSAAPPKTLLQQRFQPAKNFVIPTRDAERREAETGGICC
jgi:hypothetical protein